MPRGCGTTVCNGQWTMGRSACVSLFAYLFLLNSVKEEKEDVHNEIVSIKSLSHYINFSTATPPTLSATFIRPTLIE